VNLSLPLFDTDDLVDAALPLPAGGVGAGMVTARSGAGTGGATSPVAPPTAATAAWAPTTDTDAPLHPGVWRASQIGGGPRRVTASGFPLLDAQLPGGGWPHGVLTELLLPEPGVGELRLLAPALATVAPLGAAPASASASASTSTAGGSPTAPPDAGRCVMLFDPPALLSAWALVQCGLGSRHWLVVQGRAGQARAGQALAGPGVIAPGAPRGANRLAPLLASADLLWALEQSLKSGHVGAVLAWLPLNLRADVLRRLQLAAQAHDGPVFIFRDALARSQPSAAPLRLLLQPAGIDGLSVRLLKRRGPALAQPLRLALPPVLAPHQQARAQAQADARAQPPTPPVTAAAGATAGPARRAGPPAEPRRPVG